MTQIPPSKLKLTGFAWFDYIRPTGPDDVFVWKGKPAGTELKNVERVAMPLQRLDDDKKDGAPADDEKKQEPAAEDSNAEPPASDENS